MDRKVSERMRSERGVPITPAPLSDFATFPSASGDGADLNYLKTLNDVPHLLSEEDLLMLHLSFMQFFTGACWCEDQRVICNGRAARGAVAFTLRHPMRAGDGSG